MKTYFSIICMVLMAGMLFTGTATVSAQEGAGVFKSEQGQEITPDRGVIKDEGFFGEYDDDHTNDWWYDTYSYEEEGLDTDVRGYYGEEGDVMDWYNEDNYYTGDYDDTWDENDWYFDTYEDTGDEGFWDF